AAGFEGQCNPRDLFTGPDRFIAPAMQQAKKPLRARFQLLLRLALNAGEHTGDQPARLAQLDDGNDCAILVQGDEGPAQVVQLGHKGTPSVSYLQRRWCHLLRRLPHTISPQEGSGFEPPVPLPRLSSIPAVRAEIIGRSTDVFRRDREFDVSALQGRLSTSSQVFDRPGLIAGTWHRPLS